MTAGTWAGEASCASERPTRCRNASSHCPAVSITRSRTTRDGSAPPSGSCCSTANASRTPGRRVTIAYDLRGTNAISADIQDAVGASVDPCRPTRAELDEVPVAPDTLVGCEVGMVKFLTGGVVEEPEWPRWEGGAAYQLTHAKAGCVGRARTSRPRLGHCNSPRRTGRTGLPRRKQPDDVRASGNRVNRDVCDMARDPIELVIAKYCSGRQQQAELVEPMAIPRLVRQSPRTAAGKTGLVPKTVTRDCSTIDHKSSGALTGSCTERSLRPWPVH